MGSKQQSPTNIFELVNSRYPFLTALNTEIYRKRGLVAKLDVSRSKVDRAIRELETAQLVTKRTTGYQITLYGRTLLACYESVLDMIADVQRAKSPLAHLPPDVDIEFSLLLDAEVHVAAQPAAPYTPASYFTDFVEDADHLKGLMYTHTSLKTIEIFEEQVIGDGMPTELVFQEEGYNALKETYPDVIAELTNSDAFTGFVAEKLPYGLFLLSMETEITVCLVVYNPDWQLQGIIVNNTPRAIEWGKNVFGKYRAQAVPLDAKTSEG